MLEFAQLAGVVAVEVTGGPTVEFVPGRRVRDITVFEYMMHLSLCSLS